MNNENSEIRGGVKAFLLAHEIQSGLNSGADLEKIIAAKVTTMDAPTLKADVEKLNDGIAAVHNTAVENVDSEWVNQRLNSALVGKTTDQRADYLVGLIEAAAAAYPTVVLKDGEAELLASVKTAEEKTDENVSELLAIVTRFIPQIGALMQISYFRGMSKLVDRVDTKRVTEQIDFGENYEAAYAAACYILYKNGELIFAEGTNGKLSAYMLGTIAAANVENSKLMMAFSAGKITAEYLGERLCALYTAAVTFISENAIHIAAVVVHSVTAASLTLFFTAVCIEFGVAAYISPFIIFAFACSAAFEMFTVDEVESAIKTVWDVLKGVWGFIRNALPIRPRDDDSDTDSSLEEDSSFEEDSDEEAETSPVRARA